MENYHSENIEEIEESLSHGVMINDKLQHQEYDFLIANLRQDYLTVFVDNNYNYIYSK